MKLTVMDMKRLFLDADKRRLEAEREAERLRTQLETAWKALRVAQSVLARTAQDSIHDNAKATIAAALSPAGQPEDRKGLVVVHSRADLPGGLMGFISFKRLVQVLRTSGEFRSDERVTHLLIDMDGIQYRVAPFTPKGNNDA